jgi:hypothetical protein
VAEADGRSPRLRQVGERHHPCSLPGPGRPEGRGLKAPHVLPLTASLAVGGTSPPPCRGVTPGGSQPRVAGGHQGQPVPR